MDIDKAAICMKAFSVANENDKIYLDYRYSYTLDNRPPTIHEYKRSSDFLKDTKNYLDGLRKAIENDIYDIEIDTKKDTIEWFEEIKRIPNFYDILIDKKKINFSQYKDIMGLVEKTNGYRHKKSYELESNEMENVEKLHDLLIHVTYPVNTILFVPEESIDNIHFKGNPVFTSDEFLAPFAIENLCKVINDDDYGIPLTNDINSIEKFLRVPDIYDRICQKKTEKQFSSKTKDLVNVTNEYRDKIFHNLRPSEQGNILWLNRLLLQELYPHETPIKKNREEYEIFIKLEDILGEEIVSKIKKLKNPYRCLLLVGTDDDLMIGVVSYIYFHHCYGKLKYHDCLNWDIQDFNRIILTDKERGIYYFFNGNTLYLDLRSPKGLAIFKKLAKEIRNRFIKDYREKISYGMLIVSLTSTDNLPEEFIKLFEVIELDINKQKRIPVLSHTNSESKEQDRINNMPLNTIDKQVVTNVFRWFGGTCEITYDGTTILLSDSKGLRYIHHLILNMNKEFYCLDLLNVTESIQSEENKKLLLERGKEVENDELDERVKEGIPPKKLKEALYVLNEKLKKAETPDDREDIQEKIDQITERLESIQGENSANKAYKAIYANIKRALEKIKKEHHSLYEHFEHFLKTGNSFIYKPTEPIHWTLK